ncbi:hypothetical protein [Streptomyces sp. 351MFTsu5.1]|uniref:hypothetical protein n=1 Tax=Streptomyces sp. 351MFTsu5.1 TaxID=1172180 RepID=UPI0003810694|nr:hypothetical protein [Streptomyces sp. 351MFTsu5.1]
MTSRTKTKAAEGSDSTAEDTAAEDTVKAEAEPACGAVHTLPLLVHITCQRPAHHTDEQPQGADQVKHRARVDGALYLW